MMDLQRFLFAFGVYGTAFIFSVELMSRLDGHHMDWQIALMLVFASIAFAAKTVKDEKK